MFPNWGCGGEDVMIALVCGYGESRQKNIALALQEDGFEVIKVVGRDNILNHLPKCPDLIIVDEDLPPGGGLKWVSLLRGPKYPSW
jgi:hypothetical protein